jgi:hypothetical protein
MHLDLSVLNGLNGRILPDIKTTNGIQVILEHPQRADAFATAINSVTSIRKAHLDEVPSTATPPIDEALIPSEVRRLILSPFLGFTEGNRGFVTRLIDAVGIVQVSIPAYTGDLKSLVDSIAWLGAHKGTYPSWPIIAYRATDGYLTGMVSKATVNYTKPAAIPIGLSWDHTVQWGALGGDPEFSGEGADPNSLEFGAGYAGQKADPNYVPSTRGQGWGKLNRALIDMLDAAYTAEGDPTSGDVVSVPSLITDIAGYWGVVYTALRELYSDYVGDTVKFLSDEDLAVLTSTFESL